MSGCRISKVTLKNNGATIHVLRNRQRNHFHSTIEQAAQSIEDGTTTHGVSYNPGFSIAQLKGACEHMKDSLVKKVFDEG